MSTPSRRLGIVVVATALAAAVPAPAETATKRVVLVLSHDAEPYHGVQVGFSRRLGALASSARIEVVQLLGQADQADQSARRIAENPPTLTVTVGSLATRAMVEAGSVTPLVAAMIVDASPLDTREAATAVVLEYPLRTQLAWIRRFLPSARTIGILFGTDANERKVETARPAARSLGMEVVARRVRSPKELPRALQSLTQTADVLLGIPDPVVLRSETARQLLVFSYRNRVPFVGPSETWVKAGALYALHWSFDDIGDQAATLAARILDGEAPGSIPVVTPRRIVYSINTKAIRHMKISLPPGLVDGAQGVH